MSEVVAQLPRVLIVDDSRMVRASLSKQIRDKFDVREESDGEAGWQTLLLDPTIEVVISDIGMPRLDGFGLLARIRGSRLSRVNSLPVLIISGEDENEARMKAQGMGATDFITKGTPRVELVARIEALAKRAQTRRELEESREQLVRRNRGDVSVMVVQVDHYDQICERFGHSVGQLVHRKLSKLLSAKVRKEDTIAHLAEGQFAVISPSADLDACGAFALRLRRAIETIVMTYKEHRIRISLTIGLTSAHGDPNLTLEELLQLAVSRVAEGTLLGGNRVVSESGEVNQDNIGRFSRLAVSVDHALTQIRSGSRDEARKRLRELAQTLMPLLELMEQDFDVSLNLLMLAEKAQITALDLHTATTVTASMETSMATALTATATNPPTEWRG
ncbi:MAG: diguanylate cyclase response regulator [Candidatus Dactylopiibacterium carminicum]|uniref:Diguanylate cyclase response regulator n=1 Tax=Candidatus Dactylopiibacterium carminicum TaxID=857335 RepID=A0A272ETJ0_9RHOO|nr:diguanylate cyclase [Candidatus Dactylopiibacterium carminicum]KAF7599419.1 diguanylate cyclase response regulator [Candidatus Dactylopiibacterium carminicum]PAS93423.1 MAG: diguanylate cyclase response regulator [Candidatus Dactylopiibacterium carminicum]PAS95942.1 MAG: diguanylate cyclase response regulator [Candidatus Dactylopiibacterium carminicum]